jgi:hypothetical protein
MVDASGWIGSLANPEYIEKALDEIWDQHGPSRKVIIPDFRGLRGDDIWLAGLRTGVKIKLHRQNEDQTPGPIVVISQDVVPGTKVRRDSLVNLLVGFTTKS